MNLRLFKRVAVEIGLVKFKPYLNNTESWNWKNEATINLATLNVADLDKLERIFTDNQYVLGVKVLLRDIAVWRAALGKKDPKIRAFKHFKPLLVRLLGAVDGHRLYEKYDGENNIWLAHYVEKIEYRPEERSRGERVTPAHVDVSIVHEQFGGRKSKTVVFWPDECVGLTSTEALARKGYYVETPELRLRYLSQAEDYGALVKKIGKQMLATGTATDNLDGNTSRNSSWYWRRVNEYEMERNGEKSRVVVDVFREDDKERDDDRVYLNSWFWLSSENKALIKASDDEDDRETEEIADDENIERPEIEVPIHAFVAVFDLKRHLRLQIHVNYLTPYVYDATIADKLIIPKEQKDLVKLLINHSGAVFNDIVKGKAGGAVVLLTGQPGVGKTLTAEVYAESERRALYSIQCSQLGTDPNELEDALLKVFARAKRWNAVMLLDEADVYVHERGSDLTQNAIVGVFLRVLEYQSTVLFLTTNRPDDVDDAIASRCVARLSYKVPSIEDQARIWRVLSDASRIKLDDKTIAAIVKRNTDLTGRDVKNLLKLANLVSRGTKEPISAGTIEFVRRFKPTGREN